jgi:hypothetical protein
MVRERVASPVTVAESGEGRGTGDPAEQRCSRRPLGSGSSRRTLSGLVSRRSAASPRLGLAVLGAIWMSNSDPIGVFLPSCHRDIVRSL